MRDFSRPRPKIEFTIDQEIFGAVPAIPGDTLLQFVVNFAGGEDTPRTLADQLAGWRASLKLVLLPESYARFEARLRDPERPIEASQVSDVLVWLMELYGDRPTQPSSHSVDGSSPPGPGPSTTESAQPPESTPALSPPPVS